MNEQCSDNRFEIIEKAKKDMLDSTNINTSEKEMEVLDRFLFRCWQMGWLKEYDNSTKGKEQWIEKAAAWLRMTMDFFNNGEFNTDKFVNDFKQEISDHMGKKQEE